MANVSYEPMDIDSSANSCTAMEISYNDIVFEDDVQKAETVLNSTHDENEVYTTIRGNTYCQGVKKFHIDMTPLQSKRNLFQSNIYVILIFVSVILSILSFTVLNFKCYKELDLNLLKETLISKVYGQSEALEAFIRALEINVPSKILFLYGGTGVGKTLSISILLDKLLNYTNVYHYTMPSFTDKFYMDLNLGFHFCQSWFIIVDDLNAEDKDIVPIMTEIIEKSESFKKNVIIILVYNCNILNNWSTNCDNLFVTRTQQVFINVNAVKKFIRYKPLTQEILRKCIEIELEHSRIRNTNIEKIMKKFNVSYDGCKGVYTKVKALKVST